MLKTRLMFPFFGIVTGYCILHPISMILYKRDFSLTTIRMSFSASHLDMSIYFSLLGLLLGILVAVLQVSLLNKKKELELKNVLLNRSNAEKETLLRILSHDLINLVGSSNELLKMMFEDPEQFSKTDTASNTQQIITSLTEACHLIRHSQQLIAISNGTFEMVLVTSDIVMAVKETAAAFAETCNQNQRTITLNVPDHPVYSRTEPTLFKHTILDTIIDNAIKLSFTGQPVQITLTPRTTVVLLEISTIGPEINSEKLQTLFSLSQTPSPAGTNQERRAGFELSLASQYIRLMHGTISVASQPSPDKSNSFINTFSIELPISTEKQPQ